MFKIYFVEFHYVKYTDYSGNVKHFINEICVIDKDDKTHEKSIVYFNTFRWPTLILSKKMRITYEHNRMWSHGLDVSKGTLHRNEIKKLWPILRTANVIFVRGEEKKKILMYELRPTITQILNITLTVSKMFESTTRPNIYHLPGYVPYDYLLKTYNNYNWYCEQHQHSVNHQHMCCVRKVFSLREWFLQNYFDDYIKQVL